MSKKKLRDIELFIVDIFVAIQKIKEYTEKFTSEEDLRYSSLHWDATIRELEIIGEALNNLLDDDYFCSLSLEYFRKIVNFRNVVAHGYFGIDASEVWNIVNDKLDILLVDMVEIIKDKIDLTEAIESQIEDYGKLRDIRIVKYLRLFL
ncbi:MAG: hypothetical protein QG558_1727 [Campylobacterota bacterium]|nr:hypothetical protein [Campylobacterota bacterium]